MEIRLNLNALGYSPMADDTRDAGHGGIYLPGGVCGDGRSGTGTCCRMGTCGRVTSAKEG